MDGPTALALTLALKQNTPKKKRKWAKNWFQQREKFGHTILLKELRDNEQEDYKNFLRMDGDSFDELVRLVTPLISKQDTVMRASISAAERLSITLRYLATGNTFEDLKFMSAISPQAIGRIVMETCNALNKCLESYIKLPTTAEEWKQVTDDFSNLWNIPHCVGSIDGKHVAIRKPPGTGSFYFNYKKHFSIVLMAVVNARYEFIMADAGINGRVSDGGVLSHTTFGNMMEQGELKIPEAEPLHEDDAIDVPYFFVADDAFAMTENLLKPHSVVGNNAMDLGKRIFNYRLSRARRVVENVFGIFVSRYGVFQRPMMLSPEKAAFVTLTCCYLHNFLRRKSNRYLVHGSVDWEDDLSHEVHAGEWRATQTDLDGLRHTFNRNMTERAKFARETLQRYFCSRGSVPWQLECVS